MSPVIANFGILTILLIYDDKIFNPFLTFTAVKLLQE
jgi:hypothetical protein